MDAREANIIEAYLENKIPITEIADKFETYPMHIHKVIRQALEDGILEKADLRRGRWPTVSRARHRDAMRRRTINALTAPRIDEALERAVRSHVVDGLSFTEAGKLHGMTKGRVAGGVYRYWLRIERAEQLANAA